MPFSWVDQAWGIFLLGVLAGILMSALMFRWKT